MDGGALAQEADVPAGTSEPAQRDRYRAAPKTASTLSRGNTAAGLPRARGLAPPAPSQTVLDEAGGIHVSGGDGPATGLRFAATVEDAATVLDGADSGRRPPETHDFALRCAGRSGRPAIGQCRFPGCQNRRCDAHHIRHWADAGATALDNLVLLCRSPHSTRKLFIVKYLCKFSSHASLVVSLFSNRNLLAHGSPLWNSPVRRD